MERKTERFLWIFSIIMIVSFFYLSHNASSFKEEADVTYYDNLFKTAMSFLNEQFVDSEKVSTKELYYGAIQGMYTATKDPYTNMLEPKVLESLMETIQGEFEGIGAFVGMKNNRVVIISPIDGSPAQKAGVRPGDLIMKIEQKDTENMKLEEAVSLLRGTADTKVQIEVFRKGLPKMLKIVIERKKIEVPSVRYSMLNEDKIGYIKISNFGDRTDTDLEKAVEDLKSKGMKKILIDLRYNPGGSLKAVVDMADLFLKKGLIVYTVGKKMEGNQRFFSDDKTLVDQSMPMAILINKGSASASEIFAGAMKDRGRGIVVGEKSYGKGTVQNVFKVIDKDQMIGLKITIAKYYTPGGYVIEGNGIEPNVKVAMPEMTPEEELHGVRLIEEKLIEKFVEKNPDAIPAKEFDAFKKTLDSKGIKIRDLFLRKMIHEEQNILTGPKIVDLEYDTQAKKAIEILNGK